MYIQMFLTLFRHCKVQHIFNNFLTSYHGSKMSEEHIFEVSAETHSGRDSGMLLNPCFVALLRTGC